jgi:hypothetical protein
MVPANGHLHVSKRRKVFFYLEGINRQLVLLLFVIAIAACGEHQNQLTAPAFDVSKEYKRGPATLRVLVNKQQITIAERLQLVLEVEAQEEYEVRLPEFGEKLEQFGIVDYHSSSPRLTAEGLVHSGKTYTLEPFLSGEYIIPAMKVYFQKKDDDKVHELESEPISITVTSLLPENTKDLTIREIVPPGELMSSKKFLFYSLGGAILIAVGGALCGYFFWYRRRQKETVYTISAHEKAYEELEQLLAENLIEQGEIKQFYIRLSLILRHYIEDRFGLRAPERTTEEFLEDLRSTNLLIPAHKELLQQFLRHSDMVKFAAHQATSEEIQKSFDSCKLFIAETHSQEAEKKNSNENNLPGRMSHAV